MKRYLHVVWAPNVGLLAGYRNPELAYAHARTMVGVDVSAVEIREDLPDDARDDVESEEYAEDEVTPVDGVVVPIDQVDDGEPER